MTLAPSRALGQRREMIEPSRIEAEILALTVARGPDKSICPSEVARSLGDDALGDDWRTLLGEVRRGAVRLAEAGRIDILRKGKPIKPGEIRGVIRLRTRGAA